MSYTLGAVLDALQKHFGGDETILPVEDDWPTENETGEDERYSIHRGSDDAVLTKAGTFAVQPFTDLWGATPREVIEKALRLCGVAP